MTSTLHRLTTKQIDAAAAKLSLNDGGGLYYRSSGRRAGRWTFKFTSDDPEYLARQNAKGSILRQREMGLGTYPATSLASARDKAFAARDLVGRGRDPIEEERRRMEAALASAREAAAQAASEALTFGRYADDTFLPSVLPNFSNPAHIQQWRATFQTHAKALRDKSLASITREDVLAILKPIWSEKSVTASRSRERLERLFAHAIQNGQFHRDNPASWRQFDATLPAPRKLTRGHHASIPQDMLPDFIAQLRVRQQESLVALMVEWIALSACRTGEARLAIWSEIDLERNIWSIPAARMKMRRDHVVPITSRMVEILEVLRHRPGAELTGSSSVFCGPKGRPFSEMSALMMMRRMETYADFTVHGLRATFKGWAATTTEFARELIEEQLAHQLGDVERAYMRVSAVERRRPMMEEWAKFCHSAAGTVRSTNIA